MPKFIAKHEVILGKINATILGIFYKKISISSILISSKIYQLSKVSIGKKCLLYNCRLRVCPSSKHISIGDKTRIENNAFLNAQTGSIDIGKGCFIGPNTIIQGFGSVFIGDNVMIAANCFISSSNHIIQNVSRENFLVGEVGKRTSIGDKVWLGSNVSIVAGITVGEYSVVGAGSVVTKNIPPYSVAVGNPARVIKKIEFTNEER